MIAGCGSTRAEEYFNTLHANITMVRHRWGALRAGGQVCFLYIYLFVRAYD